MSLFIDHFTEIKIILKTIDSQETKIKDMITMVNESTGNNTPITQYPARKWDTKKRLLASIELAGKLIDYKPITSFEDGLNANFKYDIFNKKLELYPTTGKFDFIISSFSKDCGHYKFKDNYKCSIYKPLISSNLIN